MILEALKKAITDSHFTQAEIARRADVSPMTVWRIVKGIREPSLEMAEKLASAMNKKLVLK